MKTYAWFYFALAVITISSSALASGVDTSAYQGALFNGDSTKFNDAVHNSGPHFLSVGIDLSQQKRKMDDLDTFKCNRLTGILGIDLTKWLTVYGGAGEADISSDRFNKGSNFEWLAGGTLRAMDYMVLEPWNDIDNYWIGLDFNSFYRNTSVDSGWITESLSEIFGSMTFSVYNRPEKPNLWDRLGFYVGPAVSFLSKGDASEDQAFGFIGGLQLNPTPNVALKLEFQKFDDVGIGANVMFHF